MENYTLNWTEGEGHIYALILTLWPRSFSNFDLMHKYEKCIFIWAETLEWDILNPDYLIWVSKGHTR